MPKFRIPVPFQPPVPTSKWSDVPQAQPIESIEHIDTSGLCDSLGIGHMQPQSPPMLNPFNTFIAKASVPRAPDPFKSAPVNSRGTTYADTVRSANWAKTQRVVDKGPNVGHAASSPTAAGSSSASSLTAASGSNRAAADQRTRAPESTDLVTPIGG